jgi:hypothetical protein
VTFTPKTSTVVSSEGFRVNAIVDSLMTSPTARLTRCVQINRPATDSDFDPVDGDATNAITQEADTRVYWTMVLSIPADASAPCACRLTPCSWSDTIVQWIPFGAGAQIGVSDDFTPAGLAQQIRTARMAAGGRGLIEHIGTDTKV